MICIIGFNDDREIDGWILANTHEEALQRAKEAMLFKSNVGPLTALIQWLNDNPEKTAEAGKYDLPSGHGMLVS